MDNQYFIFKDSIVVHINGKTHTIGKDDPSYNETLIHIANNALDKLTFLVDNNAREDIKRILDSMRNEKHR